MRVNTTGTGFAHVLGLYDSSPLTQPDDVASTAGRVDTRAAAFNSNSNCAVGSGTAADSGSAEGSTEPLPGPSEAPKLVRQML